MTKTQALEISQFIRQRKENFLLMQELYEYEAVRAKCKYDAFILAGFTDSQALELCRPKV